MRTYPYVGPAKIAASVAGVPSEGPLRSPGDMTEWIGRYRHEFGRDGCLTATFVVDEEGFLRLADRHREHVACAGGRPVLAAGEIMLRLEGTSAVVEEIINQSTGYCPD